MDKDWFPQRDNDVGQLYMRMTHASTDEVLGVRTSQMSKILCFLCPAFMKNKNLSVKCSDGVNKNWPLGHG